MNVEKVAQDARAAWREAGSPLLCPRCGGWDGPDLPFCTDGGHWTHDNTCAVYRFADDLCQHCGATNGVCPTVASLPSGRSD